MSRDSSKRDRGRLLRRSMTPAEAILWKHLRGRRFAGLKFRRQHPIGPFFADLACSKCRLIVEVDGETHLGAEIKDRARTEYLSERGWRVLRFWNTQVYDELDAVTEAIYRAREERNAQSTPSPPTPLPRVQGRGEKEVRHQGSVAGAH
jgi:adenine-specific DNA-methyltransferase